MGIQRLHHVCIQTECYSESLDFYTRRLGFSLLKESAGFHGRAYNSWLALNGFMIELQTPKAGEAFTPWSSRQAGPVHLAFLVDDVEAEYLRLQKLGQRDFKRKDGQAVYEVCGGKLLKIKAPEGTEIEFRAADIEA